MQMGVRVMVLYFSSDGVEFLFIDNESLPSCA